MPIIKVELSIEACKEDGSPVGRLRTFRGRTIEEVIERVETWARTDRFFNELIEPKTRMFKLPPRRKSDGKD